MKSIRKYSALSVFAVMLAFGASAAKADLDFVSNYLLSPVLGNPASELSWLEGVVGEDLEFLGKADWNGSVVWEWGAVDSGLNTTSWGGGNTAQVSWDLNGTGYELRYVLVKDGAISSPPGQPLHLYSLFEVTPEQFLASDWENVFFGAPYADRGISHISFFGVASTTTVPEPATLLLLGAGLIGMAMLRRRRTAGVVKSLA